MSSRHSTARRSVAFVPTGLVPAGPAPALSACGAPDEMPERNPRQVRAVAESGPGETGQLLGTVESPIKSDFSFRLGGRIIERAVDAADTADGGRLIAKLDPSTHENGLRTDEAALAAAKGRVVEARTGFERRRHLRGRKSLWAQVYQRKAAVRG